LMRGWRGKKVAIVAVVGFVAVIFTYLGVNLLLSGLHSYGSQ
jgi:ABC-type transport system involved in cytochrome c biogenesis permease subunit